MNSIPGTRKTNTAKRNKPFFQTYCKELVLCCLTKDFFILVRIFPRKFFYFQEKNAKGVLKPDAKYSIIEPMYDGYMPFCKDKGELRFKRSA